MEAGERIQGIDRVDLLMQLKKDKTLVKMKLSGKDYEQLTMITGVRTAGKHPVFLIDLPFGFKQAVSAVDIWNINFEFVASDGVQYKFKTSGGKITGSGVRINLPNFIERLQRRKDFRLDFNPGTEIRFEQDGFKYELGVINLSMGGVLATLPIPFKGIQVAPVFDAGRTLRDIELVSPLEGRNIRVEIKKALILRSNRDNKPGQYIFGLQFLEIENDEIKALRELIYNLQRDFLKKRLKTNS